MEWDRLRAFLAVAEHGGFSAAARALGKTQSAMSQAVAALEEELGQALLVRQRRGTALTDAGRILLEHGQGAQAQLTLAERRLAALAPLEDGRLTVGTSDTLGYYFLPPALSAFRARHPRVEVHLSTAPSPQVAEAVARNAVDVGIISLPLPDRLPARGRARPPELALYPLRDEPDVLLVRRGHPLATRRSVRLSQLAGEELLLLGRGTAGRDVLERAFADLGIRPIVRMEMNSVELLKRMVELGFGAAVVPAMAVQREVQAGDLLAIPIRDSHAQRQVGLALPGGGPLSHAAAAFAALVRGLPATAASGEGAPAAGVDA